MTLLDRVLGRHERGFNPANASGAAIFATTYGNPGKERLLPTFQSYSEGGYHGNGIVFSVILARLMLFSEAEFKFQRWDDRSLFGSPDLMLLEEPWPGATTGELLARMEQDVSLAGNAFVRNVDGMMLERLRPDRVTIVSELRDDALGRPYRQVVGYYYEPLDLERGGAQFFDVSEVAHWSPIPDPLAEYRGMSWLTPVVREIDADSGLTQYKQVYIEQAATPNMVIRYDERLKPEHVAEVQERLLARHGGVNNAFKTLVLDRGADLTVVGNSLEQMAFTTVQAAGENRIAAAGGVPGIVVGLKEGLDAATYSNYEQAMRRFADLTMRPLWRSACASLAKLVPVPNGSRLWYDPSQITALRQGEKERAETFNVHAESAALLLRVGYAHESIASAVGASDLSLLRHTGKLPVTLYQDGVEPTSSAPEPERADPVVVNVDAAHRYDGPQPIFNVISPEPKPFVVEKEVTRNADGFIETVVERHVPVGED